MIRTTADVSLAALATFDAIVDVRSPSEFAEDHLPGAINLPVLDDAQRAAVGTEYVQGSKFLARRHGAALVARNIAAHLEGSLADRAGGFRPLVHCWRGGQRSHAMATVMDQVGWPVTVLEGGYRTWRRAVVERLHDRPLGFDLILIDGPTGCGKTALLQHLAVRGVQTLDLEGLANHRGSLFGAMPGGQPSQKLFESRLFAGLESLDPSRPVVVEAESSRVGGLGLPKGLWQAMLQAPVIALTASVPARVDFTCVAYADVASDTAALSVALSRLPRHLSKALIAEWRDLAGAGRVRDLAEALIREHYDPAYARSCAGRGRPTLRSVALSDLDPESLERAAADLAPLIESQTAA
ncbi:MAG TPA: tRNA 2-selenouridine(34) synthase MnmH [Brevundimonas sp.]|uniref:tRNA 2-selenouridine(34) synthase MnmH n=1 Tax=Brevundimonas sp. TaxID=1871086 RepID=UPI002DE8F60B|nr:tRNA 2-selenouridine(34) synthase MnmH [Brevundimonas sp.]